MVATCCGTSTSTDTSLSIPKVIIFAIKMVTPITNDRFWVTYAIIHYKWQRIHVNSGWCSYIKLTNKMTVVTNGAGPSCCTINCRGISLTLGAQVQNSHGQGMTRHVVTKQTFCFERRQKVAPGQSLSIQLRLWNSPCCRFVASSAFLHGWPPAIAQQQ